ISLFSHAVRVDERNDIAKDFLASAMLEAGRLDEAAELATRARELNPKNDRPLVTLASIAEQKGDIDGAVSLYREALELRPDQPLVQCQLGLLELDRGNLDVARTLMTPALRSSGLLVVRTLELARGTLEQGHGDVARFLYEIVLAVAPENADARAGMGMVLLARGDAAAAIEHLVAASKDMPTRADLQLALARCAHQLGRSDEAGQALARAVAAAADDPAIFAGAAELHARRREFATSTALYRRVVALAPNDSHGHAALGYMLILTGDREGGRAAWKRALELDPGFPGLRERLQRLEP
ncbi:MAG TPA: tetratricopeptide repeat protein, partial [Opitutaceae bacterium]